MNFYLTQFCLGFILLCSFPTMVQATETNILILGEEGEKRSISRNHPVFKSVLGATSNWLGQKGFRIFNKTIFEQFSVSRGQNHYTLAKAIEHTKAIKTPIIDAIVVLSLLPEIKVDKNNNLINVNVSGKIINVSTGALIGNIEAKLPEYYSVLKSCLVHRDCILESIKDHSEKLGEETGVLLEEHFKQAMHPSKQNLNKGNIESQKPALIKSYNLTFNNFEPYEFNFFEERVSSLSDYHRHEIILSMSRRFEINYETRSDDAKLKQNLRVLIDQLKVNASLKCMKNSCTISKF